MKALTIKEIKERCENDDKVDFKGIVEKVWQFNEKKTDYKIGYQNIIVKDDTDKIKIIFTIKKSKEELYDSSIEGKKVEVSGKVSIYNEQTNVFGKLIFEEDKKLESPKGIQSRVSELKVAPVGLTQEEIRVKCLELSQKVLKDDNPGTKNLIEAAQQFESYVCNPGVTIKIQNTKGEKTTRKKKGEEEEEPKGNLSTEHIKKINTLMALVENRGEEGKDIITEITERNNYKSIKDFNEEAMKEAHGRLEQIGSEDIPF